MRIKRKTITWLLKRLLLLVAFLLFVALCIWGYFAYDSSADLRSATTETDRGDPSWRWDALVAARKNVPDAENNALIVLAAARLLPEQWGHTWKEAETPSAYNETPQPLIHIHPRQRLGEEAASRLAKARTEVDAAWRELQKLHPQHNSLYPLDTDVFLERGELPCADPCMDLFNACRVVSWHELHRSNAEAAWEACRVGLRLGRTLEQEPTALPFLVRSSIRRTVVEHLERMLAQGEPLAALLAAMQQDLLGEQAVPLKEMLRWERAHFEMLAAHIAEGKPIHHSGVGSLRNTALDRWLYADFLFKYGRAESLRQFQELIAIVEKPHPQRWIELEDWDNRCKLRSNHIKYKLGLMLPPAVHKVILASSKEEVTLRCAVAALAAERFRRKHGRWPGGWEELVPTFLPAVPQDVFRDAPLLLKPTPDGLVIYSVGADGDDNNGRLNHIQNPLSCQPTDIGFQLWNPDVRRQPLPLPEKKDDE